jgi:hypothetical protein
MSSTEHMLGHGYYNKHYYRTADEWRAPLAATSELTRETRLVLSRFEEVTLPDVYLERFQEDHDAGAFARAYTEFFRAAYEPCLFASLGQDRDTRSRQAAIDAFAQRLEAALARNPARYASRWVLHLIGIRKGPERRSA